VTPSAAVTRAMARSKEETSRVVLPCPGESLPRDFLEYILVIFFFFVYFLLFSVLFCDPTLRSGGVVGRLTLCIMGILNIAFGE